LWCSIRDRNSFALASASTTEDDTGWDEGEEDNSGEDEGERPAAVTQWNLSAFRRMDAVPLSPSVQTRADRVRPWANRVVWAMQVVLLGQGLGPSLAGHSRPVQLVGTLLAWAVWTVGLAAVALAHPAGLTTLRLCLTALVGATAWIVVADGPATWQQGMAVVGALAAFATIGSAETATWCIDGPAYPNESRHALKIPIGLAPISAITSALTVAALIAGPLLLAARAWILGALLSAAALGVAWVGVRSLHQLSRRFIVFVPAGFVVHDHLALFDPVLFRRNVVEHIGLALADTDSLDLTLGATGMPLEVLLTEKVELTKLSPDRRTGEVGRTARFLVSPVRPGAVLREAAARRYAV
jgi:hypothetical protein